VGEGGDTQVGDRGIESDERVADAFGHIATNPLKAQDRREGESCAEDVVIASLWASRTLLSF